VRVEPKGPGPQVSLRLVKNSGSPVATTLTITAIALGIHCHWEGRNIKDESTGMSR
jgi:hypothetical protein